VQTLNIFGCGGFGSEDMGWFRDVLGE